MQVCDRQLFNPLSALRIVTSHEERLDHHSDIMLSGLVPQCITYPPLTLSAKLFGRDLRTIVCLSNYHVLQTSFVLILILQNCQGAATVLRICGCHMSGRPDNRNPVPNRKNTEDI